MCAVADSPVYLGGYVVERLLRYPCDGVGVDVVVLPVAACGATGNAVFAGYIGVGACYACWRHAEAYPWFRFLDGGIHGGYHAVHVVAAPVADAEVSAGVLVCVVEVSVVAGVCAREIEVVVEEYAVDVVVGNDFIDDVAYALCHFGEAGVENGCSGAGAVGHVHNPVGVGVAVVAWEACPLSFYAFESIGVEPCMAFEASLVAFLHDEFEGVPSGILASGIHQVGAPRLEGRAVHGVASRAHLEVDGVEVVDFQRVEQCNHLLLLFFNLGSVSCRTDHGLGPVETPDCRHPSRAHLSVGH